MASLFAFKVELQGICGNSGMQIGNSDRVTDGYSRHREIRSFKWTFFTRVLESG